MRRLEQALRQILSEHPVRTQEELAELLIQGGVEDISQSKISRMLRKVGAVKANNAKGEQVYCLPKEPAPPLMQEALDTLVLDIVSNEVMIMIYTSPGAASLIGRVLDFRQNELEIIGTIAGDDTLLVLPKSVHRLSTIEKHLKELLNI